MIAETNEKMGILNKPMRPGAFRRYYEKQKQDQQQVI